MTSPTLIVDRHGRILAWSDEAARLLGHSAAEAIGRSIEIIIPGHLRGPHDAGFLRFVQTGLSHLPEVVTTSALHSSGEIVRLKISVKAVRNAQGEIAAVEATMFR